MNTVAVAVVSVASDNIVKIVVDVVTVSAAVDIVNTALVAAVNIKVCNLHQ